MNSSCAEESRDCSTGVVLEIKTLLFNSRLRNMVPKHLQTTSVQKYGEVLAFVFTTCCLGARRENSSSTEVTPTHP